MLQVLSEPDSDSKPTTPTLPPSLGVSSPRHSNIINIIVTTTTIRIATITVAASNLAAHAAQQADPAISTTGNLDICKADGKDGKGDEEEATSRLCVALL